MRDKNSLYIIAETAYSFEGDATYLLSQTQNLSEKIDAIKYHVLFDINEYMDSNHSVYPLLKSWIIKKDEWINIFKSAKKKGHDVIVLTDDRESVGFLCENSELVDGIEVHAACINDKALLDDAIIFSNKYNKPLYVGISGFEIDELFVLIDYIKAKQCHNLVLMYGFQNYPTRIEDVGLAKIPYLSKLFDLPVGYADHTGYDENEKEHLISTAYTLGANIQEIHYVLNEGEKRTDYITAVSSDRLEKIRELLINTEISIGRCDFRLNAGEKKYLNFRKVAAYSKDMKEGHVIEEADINFIRIENPSVQHKFLEENLYVGKRLNKCVKKGEEIKNIDFECKR